MKYITSSLLLVGSLILLFCTSACHRKGMVISYKTYIATDVCSEETYEYVCNVRTIGGKYGKTMIIEGLGGFDDPVSSVELNKVKGKVYQLPEQTDAGYRIIEGTSNAEWINRRTFEMAYIIYFEDGESSICKVTLEKRK